MLLPVTKVIDLQVATISIIYFWSHELNKIILFLYNIKVIYLQ